MSERKIIRTDTAGRDVTNLPGILKTWAESENDLEIFVKKLALDFVAKYGVKLAESEDQIQSVGSYAIPMLFVINDDGRRIGDVVLTLIREIKLRWTADAEAVVFLKAGQLTATNTGLAFKIVAGTWKHRRTVSTTSDAG